MIDIICAQQGLRKISNKHAEERPFHHAQVVLNFFLKAKVIEEKASLNMN